MKELYKVWESLSRLESSEDRFQSCREQPDGENFAENGKLGYQRGTIQPRLCEVCIHMASLVY
jgi:hypothetical protein